VDNFKFTEGHFARLIGLLKSLENHVNLHWALLNSFVTLIGKFAYAGRERNLPRTTDMIDQALPRLQRACRK
jgi:hypothetical protein